MLLINPHGVATLVAVGGIATVARLTFAVVLASGQRKGCASPAIEPASVMSGTITWAIA